MTDRVEQGDLLGFPPVAGMARLGYRARDTSAPDIFPARYELYCEHMTVAYPVYRLDDWPIERIVHRLCEAFDKDAQCDCCTCPIRRRYARSVGQSIQKDVT